MRGFMSSVIASALLCSAGAGAVELSSDARGQVLLLPFVEATEESRSELLVRNASPTEGKAVRVVARDPLQGRPTASVNVYLGPLDAWRSRIDLDPASLAAGDARARLVVPDDASCTHPARDVLESEGLVFSDALFARDAVAPEPGDRLTRASIEVFEMGTIDAGLAADCEEIRARWADGGVWAADPGADVSAPTGTLGASVSIVGKAPPRAFQYRAVALDDFRDAPLHADVTALSPHLGDVSPAVSSTFETVQLAQRRVRLEQRSTWSDYPVNAVNAVLMAGAARGEFVSNRTDRGSREAQGFAGAVLAFPTRAFHTDPTGFYLPAGTVPRAGPFAAGDVLDLSVADPDGKEFTIGVSPGLESCDLARASVTRVVLSDSVFFSGRCDQQTAIFFVAGPPNEGRLEFRFAGEIVSDEGNVVRGRPVLPILLQSLREPGTTAGTFSTSGWAEYMALEREE